MVVVLDTDVMAAAVVSATGASHVLLQEIGLGRLAAAASVPLLLEYEAVLKRSDTLRRASWRSWSGSAANHHGLETS